MPSARYFFSAGVVNNKIYVIGGSSSGPNDTLSAVEEYDPALDTWAQKAEMPPASARFGPGTSVINNKIFVIAGAAGFEVSPLVNIYSPADDTWKRLPDMPNPRAGSASTVNGKIYFIGGALTVKPPHPAVSTVEVYSPEEF